MNDRGRQVSVLSRSACLAERNEACRKVLFRNKKIPSRRAVWLDLTNSAGSDFNTSEYCGRSRPSSIRQFYSPPAYFAGFTQRIGDPFDPVTARWPHRARSCFRSFRSMPGTRKNAARVNQIDTAKKERTVKNTTLYSQFATNYLPEASNG